MKPDYFLNKEIKYNDGKYKILAFLYKSKHNYRQWYLAEVMDELARSDCLGRQYCAFCFSSGLEPYSRFFFPWHILIGQSLCLQKKSYLILKKMNKMPYNSFKEWINDYLDLG